MDRSPNATLYHPLSMRALGMNGASAWLMLTWLLSLLVCQDPAWLPFSLPPLHLPLSLGQLELQLTFYPPLALSALWMLWFGFWWGAIPVYLCTLSLALDLGIAPVWAALFALANPAAFGVITLVYRALPVSLSLRSVNSLLLFLVLAFVGHVFGSMGTFVWIYSGQLAVQQAFTTWQGWWIGGLLQTLLLIPLLMLCTPRLLAWRQAHFSQGQRRTLGRWEVAKILLLLLLGIYLFLFSAIYLSHQTLQLQGNPMASEWQAVATLIANSSILVYGSLSGLLLALAFLTYQFYLHGMATLTRMADQAATANREKSSFLACMSHEIRTALHAINGLTRLALGTLLTPTQRESLEKIRVTGLQLQRLLDELLDYAKMEAGELRLEQTDIQLDLVVHKVIEMVAVRADEKRLDLLIDLPAELPQRLQGDPLRLEQILLNLLNNAIKFTDRGEVLLRVQRLSQQPHGINLLFEVQDTGIGLTQPQIERLFQPFQQADADTSRRYGGSGLGLAICKHLVERMGGDIGVESSSGRGSRFFFQLALPGEGVAKPCLDTQSVLQGRRLLLHYDSPHPRLHLAAMLQRLGCLVESIDTEEGVLERLRAANQAGQPFELLVLGRQQPWPTDLPCICNLRQQAPFAQLPLLVLAGLGEQDVLARLLDGKTSIGLLGKPVLPAAMARALLNLLAPDAQSPKITPQCDDGTRLAGIRILLVDDNAINRRVAGEILLGVGARVDMAEDGHQAVELARQHQYDVVLMDIQMPRMDGVAATYWLRNLGYRPPIIALSANDQDSERRRCLQAGMNDYLNKPFDPQRLFATLLRWWTPPMQANARPPAGATEPGMAQAAPTAQAKDIELDTKLGLHRVGNRAELYREVLASFHPARTDTKLHDHLLQGDWPGLERLAHSLKSSAYYLGADPLARAAAALETSLRDERPDQSHVGVLAGRLSEQLDRLRQRWSSLSLGEQDDEIQPRSQVSPSGPKVLIVDDEAIHCRVLTSILQDEFQVLLARDGTQALQLARESMPDLILLDLLLPGLNGDEVLRRLREQVATREIAVIIVSARNAVEDEEAGFAQGACDYITKPFNPAIVRARVRAALQMVNQRKLLDKLAYIDSLTELPNRRRFEQILASEWNRCARSGSPLSLAMVDVDFFKRFNDTFGHAHGDRVLRAVAEQMLRHLHRATDLAARLGGEEFVLLLPETDATGARLVAEHIRQGFEQTEPGETNLAVGQITVSIGGATEIPKPNKDPASLLAEADRMLYRAKEAGRNRVEWRPEDPPRLRQVT